MTRHVLQTEPGKFRLQILKPLPVGLEAAPHVLGVVQGGQRGPLRRRIDVERLAHAMHQGDNFLGTNAITDSQPGQTVKLGKGPQR